MGPGPDELVREEIRRVTSYHVPPAQGMVKLDAMENPYRLPPELAREMGARLAEVAINRYPDPSGELLKRRLRETMRIDASLEILLGNGSDEILQIVSLALAKPGATVLSVEPSFVVYRLAATAYARMASTSGRMSFSGVTCRSSFGRSERARRGLRLRPAWRRCGRACRPPRATLR